MTHFSVTPITPTIGAQISDIDLTQSHPNSVYDDLRETLAQHKVIFFRNQNMTDDQFQTFGDNFGNLEKHEFFPTIENHPKIQVISTSGGNTGTDRWHTDVTFRKAPSSASILRAVDIPPEGGGDTMWLCTNAAYKGLSKNLQALLLNLEGIHDMRFGMSGYLDKETVEKTVQGNPPHTHPAVIKHPKTGKPHLFLNSIWTSEIKGLEQDESKALLDFLFEHVKKPEFQVRFKWERNSIAIWDNIATQHYAVSDYNYQRVMNRMIVDGSPLEPYSA